MSKGGAGKVYFVLYLAVILELLIIIVERDEAEEGLMKKQKESMRIVESILTQLQSGAGTEGINTRPQDAIVLSEKFPAEQQKYFKIPIIIISTFNSVFAIGLTSYTSQDIVSTVNCMMSMICSIIASIELYLNLQKRIEMELTSYRSYYNLSIKINNCLKLEREHRNVKDGASFLLEIENEYKTLFNESTVNQQKIEDRLIYPQFDKQDNPLGEL